MKASYESVVAAYQRGELEETLDLCEELTRDIRKEQARLAAGDWMKWQLLWQRECELMLIAAGALHKTGDTAEGIAILRRLARITPDPTVHFNLSLMLLYAGEFREAWPEFEWRHKVRATPVVSGPRWQGEDLDGKTILVITEEGFGDCIQFARYLPLLRQRAGRLMFACPPALAPLFADEPYVDEIIHKVDAATRYDYWVTICSLAGLFEAAPGNVPPAEYLHSRPRRPTWAPRVASERFNVGIAWAGDTRLEDDIHRSAQVRDFLCLLEVDGVSLYSLQLHDPMNDLPDNFHQLGTELQDFADTASIIDLMDLVISVDTATAHLSLTLGCETWVVLPKVTDWRWVGYFRNGDIRRAPEAASGCIWYPRARMFKQQKRRDWAGVMAGVCTALQERVSQRSDRRSD